MYLAYQGTIFGVESVNQVHVVPFLDNILTTIQKRVDGKARITFDDVWDRIMLFKHAWLVIPGMVHDRAKSDYGIFMGLMKHAHSEPGISITELGDQVLPYAYDALADSWEEKRKSGQLLSHKDFDCAASRGIRAAVVRSWYPSTVVVIGLHVKKCSGVAHQSTRH